jgi:hypothetical protein
VVDGPARRLLVGVSATEWVRVVGTPHGDTIELLVTTDRQLVVRVWDARMQGRAEIRLPIPLAVQLSWATGDAMEVLGSDAPVAQEALGGDDAGNDTVRGLLERVEQARRRVSA